MSIYQFNKEPVWLPDEKSGGNMKAFIKIIEKKYRLKFDGYWDFHRWTVDNIPEFWEEIWHFFGIVSSKPYKTVVDLTIPMELSPKWFEGARLNFAENLLKFRSDHTALIATGEGRDVERISFKQLFEMTKTYAAALKKFGLQKGDTVACYMSNGEEAVIAMLAVTSIGAIWTGALPTLGSQAVLNRLKQVQPKVLFTIDQFSYNKEAYHLLKNIKDITEGLPTLEKVIIVASKPESKKEDISHINNSCFLDDFLRTAYNADGTLPELVFEQVSFSHPVFINFTSGTTGVPKTIVHGAGGLLTTARDFGLHYNSVEGDIWLFMSTVGWASWNVFCSLLFLGITVVLFEGNPYFLSSTYLWDLVDTLKVTSLFITPSVLDEMEIRNILPTKNHNLCNLHTIMSGGAVVKPNNFEFGFKLKKGIRMVAGCGSTETMGSIFLQDSTLPIYVGELSTPSLGIALECLDDEGNPLLGEIGECVISKPSPSFPLGLWKDYNNEMYKKTYFSKYPGKFVIGDSILVNPVTKGIIICGRSDETIKQRGCRFGSSEIYNVVKLFPEIRDSLCVGQHSKDRDERAVLFLLMENGCSFNDDLVQRLRKRIADELTTRHVPEVILEAPGIPHNANGKKTEITVKKIINGLPHSSETIQNLECLQFFYSVPELQGF